MNFPWRIIAVMKMQLYVHGWGGAALAIIRVSVGVMLIEHAKGGTLLWHDSPETFIASAMFIGLCVGIFTSLLSVMAIAVQSAYLVFVPASQSLDGFLLIPLLIAIALLGAGAYSFDGILFGRRKVVF